MTVTTRQARRAAAVLTGVLAAALLPLLGPAAPAVAEEGCTTEQGLLGQVGACDDSTPPTTEITVVDPGIEHGWIRSTSVSIRFAGAYDDADADPIAFECQLDEPVGSTDWESCTSPFTRDDLAENTATPHTFRVRAIDSADNVIDLVSPIFGGTDEPDYDQTPAEVSFTADATAPNTFGFLRTSYADESGPDGPMLVAPSAQVRLQSTQGTRYRCTLNGKAVACNDDLTTLRNLAAGAKRFSAAAVDPAGNVDPTPFIQKFFVPRNLAVGDATRASRGDWRRFRDAGAFEGDYLESSTYGATLTFPVRNVREIRLLAPTGPTLGRVEIRVGRGQWFPVNLHSNDPARLKVYEPRDSLSGLLAGILQVRVASHGKPVRVDAVSAR